MWVKGTGIDTILKQLAKGWPDGSQQQGGRHKPAFSEASAELHK
jgi:hypothetical protein